MRRPPPPPQRSDIQTTSSTSSIWSSPGKQNLWKDAPRNSDAYFGALLNSPTDSRAAFAKLGRTMREGQVRGTYSDADRELVDMVLSVDFGYRAILALHIPDAIAVGVRLEAIEALWQGSEEDLGSRSSFCVAYITGRGQRHGRRRTVRRTGRSHGIARRASSTRPSSPS